jgi:uncharacterized protein YggE
MNNILVAVIVGGMFYLLGQYIVSTPNREQQAVQAGRQITVTGEATVSTRPDIARLTLGTRTEPQSTAERALNDLTTRFNRVLEAVQKAGVAEEDVRTTQFSLDPQYDFLEGRQQLRGYVASENVIVTIRDFDIIGDVVTQATAAGANQVGGVVFEVDEQSAVSSQAEEQAIEKARQKAERLARALGVQLGPVKQYDVSFGGGMPIPFQALREDTAVGGVEPPQLPAGTNETTVTVSLVFELR